MLRTKKRRSRGPHNTPGKKRFLPIRIETPYTHSVFLPSSSPINSTTANWKNTRTAQKEIATTANTKSLGGKPTTPLPYLRLSY